MTHDKILRLNKSEADRLWQQQAQWLTTMLFVAYVTRR